MQNRRSLRYAITAALTVCFAATPALAQSAPIILAVDATPAPHHRFHAVLTIPATPGPLTLYYPKWIPGEHAPTGPINELTNLRITAGNQLLAWRRDLLDMCAIHVDVPDGADSVSVELDYLSPTGADGFTAGSGTTARLAVVDWHLMLLYPKGKPARDLTYAASLKLPPEWKCGGSLEIDNRQGDTIYFKPVTLEMLVDTPMVIGQHYKRIDLSPTGPIEHCIDMIADSEAALAVPPERMAAYKKLILEAKALYGHRHYNRYHFLLTLSDHTAHFGLEHHQCSDDRVEERFFIDKDIYERGDGLLTHEYTHSWCGKYRRPAGLATPAYDTPMTDDLLWVYEGLTSYLGNVLAVRSDLYTLEQFTDVIAADAANVSIPGRTWRPLQDTCDAAQKLYAAGDVWESRRRRVDFYPEGVLLWLEIDVMIRAQTGGAKSIEDFCRAFLGGDADTPPEVRPYTFDDIVAALNAVSPHDWRKHLTERLTSLNPRPPLGGVEGAGWKLVFTDRTNPRLERHHEEDDYPDLRFSLGLALDADGHVIDVLRDSPADSAGLAPGMKVIGVNGRAVTKDRLLDAIDAAKGTSDNIELLVENDEFFSTHTIDYHDGQRYPHLARDESKPDVLAKIMKSLTGD